MGRYRKIEVILWGDTKFQALSKPVPNAQTLWIYLLTGPHTNAVPGLFVIGKAALAEAIDWDFEAFGKVFQELIDAKMIRFDPKTRLIWVPNAIKYNLPESPNVVRSWKAQIREIPESSLLTEALTSIKNSIYGMGEGFQKAFLEVFGKGLPQPSPNQEQEQEQEQEEEFDGPGETPTRETSTEPEPAQDPPNPIPTHGLTPPKGLCERFTSGDLDEVRQRFGTRAQEGLEIIALKLATGDYERLKRPWAMVKTWLAKEDTSLVWLDKATGKASTVPQAKPADTRGFNADPVPEAERAEFGNLDARSFVLGAVAEKRQGQRAPVVEFDPARHEEFDPGAIETG